jgi:hypothetical protein
MTKGQSYGICYDCWYFKFRTDNRNCLKYDFVFPKSTFDIFCRDFRNRFFKKLATEPRAFIYALIMGIPLLSCYIFTGGWFYGWKSRRWRKQLKASTLFYYEDQSKKPLQPLALFSELQTRTILKSVIVKNNPGVGSEILFDSDADIADIGSVFEIDVDGQKIKLGVRTERGLSLLSSQWAILFAQPEFKMYKLLPHHFR